MTYNWTQEGRRWTLDAAPRFAVEARSLGRYTMLIDDFEVDETDSLTAAKAAQQCRYEYEEHASDLELARLRLDQARDRLANRFPRAAADASLAAIFESLADALGAGPEASDPHHQEAQKTDLWRNQLSPVLWVAVEASTNVVLEVTTPHGRVLSRALVSPAELTRALGDAVQSASIAVQEAEEKRTRDIDEKRRAEGRLTKQEAVDWLVGEHSQARGAAVSIAERLKRGGKPVFGMRYELGYWIVPVQQG